MISIQQKLIGKRIFDFIASLFIVVILSPLFVLVAVVVAIGLGRPILFRQERAGINGVPFVMFKFRSMSDERDSSGQPLLDEFRLTRLGILLRKSSLDEIPEFFNILMGHMSIVGPRPLPVRYVTRYSESQRRRMLVRPGLTGLAQVNGRNNLSWDEKFELDCEYVENVSFWLDLKIVIKTVKQVIIPKNINAEGHATAPEFLGESKNG
jgi:lipopolysaccharide/colanic/teichoic acid biosynthesis glycosyltransferase